MNSFYRRQVKGVVAFVFIGSVTVHPQQSAPSTAASPEPSSMAAPMDDMAAMPPEQSGMNKAGATESMPMMPKASAHPPDCLLYTSPSPRDRQNLVCRLLLE